MTTYELETIGKIVKALVEKNGAALVHVMEDIMFAEDKLSDEATTALNSLIIAASGLLPSGEG